MFDIAQDSQTPMYQQVVDAVRDGVRSGRFAPGDRLPAKAALAEQLGVSRVTVNHSYDLLQRGGIIVQKQGSGTYIQADAPSRLQATATPGFNTIAFVTGKPSLEQCLRDTREYVTDMMLGIDDILQHSAGRFVFVDSFNRACLDDLPENSAVLVIWSNDTDPSLLEELAQRNTAVMGVWDIRYEQLMPCVSFDPFQAAEVACQHLIDCGYRRLGYIGNMGDDIPLGAKFFQFTNSLYRAGLDFELKHVREVEHNVMGAAFRAAYEIAGSGNLPDAFFVDVDHKAIEVMSALEMAGLRVPDDVGVIGGNGAPESAVCIPSLTTVATPRRQIGRRVGQMLRDFAAHGTPPQQEVVPCELIVRNSTRAGGATALAKDGAQTGPTSQ